MLSVYMDWISGACLSNQYSCFLIPHLALFPEGDIQLGASLGTNE